MYYTYYRFYCVVYHIARDFYFYGLLFLFADLPR